MARTQSTSIPPQATTSSAASAPVAVSLKTSAPLQVEAPAIQTGNIDYLAISPELSRNDGSGIGFDWELARIGTNRSYRCTVTTARTQRLSVTLQQGLYCRTFTGDGAARATVIPPAPAGTTGTLTAQNLATGASVTYSWRWQPGMSGATSPAKPPGLFARLFGKTRQSEAGRAVVKPQRLSLAERLGDRARLAVQLKFFKQEGVGQRFAFILDRSGSMSGTRWETCTSELKQALQSLPEHAEFRVVLFSESHIEAGGSGWIPATRANVESAIAWLDIMWPSGGTLPYSAFQAVFSTPPPPDVVYFLTDGDVGGFTAETCAELRHTAPTVVNTIALESDASADVLSDIAEATGGRFILVPKVPQ